MKVRVVDDDPAPGRTPATPTTSAPNGAADRFVAEPARYVQLARR